MLQPDFELRQWTEDYRAPFAGMHADPAVMWDQGGSLDRAASDAKFDRYRDAWVINGVSRWTIADGTGGFLGYAGVMKRDDPEHPLGVHYEIGWRLCRDAWGRGYATQSARRALDLAWRVLDIDEIVSYAGADNARSQKVMERLNLKRDTSRDFTARYPKGAWTGLVWAAQRPIAADA